MGNARAGARRANAALSWRERALASPGEPGSGVRHPGSGSDSTAVTDTVTVADPDTDTVTGTVMDPDTVTVHTHGPARAARLWTAACQGALVTRVERR